LQGDLVCINFDETAPTPEVPTHQM
jgi:hypothetical protein